MPEVHQEEWVNPLATPISLTTLEETRGEIGVEQKENGDIELELNLEVTDTILADLKNNSDIQALARFTANTLVSSLEIAGLSAVTSPVTLLVEISRWTKRSLFLERHQTRQEKITSSVMVLLNMMMHDVLPIHTIETVRQTRTDWPAIVRALRHIEQHLERKVHPFDSRLIQAIRAFESNFDDEGV
jgi:hypothetical protein